MKELVPEFELGLELDSAEVRGILLFNNQEWGRFDISETCSVNFLLMGHLIGLHLISWVK